MKCPYLIEPHQIIQGLDYIHIFPVIEWLVKCSEQNRAEKSERLKAFAIGQFHNHFALKSDQDSKEKYINGSSCVRHIQVNNDSVYIILRIKASNILFFLANLWT